MLLTLVYSPLFSCNIFCLMYVKFIYLFIFLFWDLDAPTNSRLCRKRKIQRALFTFTFTFIETRCQWSMVDPHLRNLFQGSFIFFFSDNAFTANVINLLITSHTELGCHLGLARISCKDEMISISYNIYIINLCHVLIFAHNSGSNNTTLAGTQF